MLAAEATHSREWTSAKGQAIVGKAMSFVDGMVTLKRSNGKEGKIAITALSEADQKFIKEHFGETGTEPEKLVAEEEGKLSDSPAPKKKREKGRKGRVTVNVEGPISSKDDSVYFYYTPESALADGSAPALFWTGGGRSYTGKDIKTFKRSADLTGMIIVLCGSSNNKSAKNTTHIHNNLMHSIEQCSIDKKRLFFGGPSGGGARTLRNASKYKPAGAMPLVGYMPSDAKPSKSAYYYVVTGANDFNRYASASVADKMGSKATLRIGSGGHGTMKNDPYLVGDGMIWMYTMHVYKGKGGSASEREGFEDRFYDHLTVELAAEPWKAYYWAEHLLETCKLSGPNRQKFATLHSELAVEKNIAYAEGLKDLEKLGMKQMLGDNIGGSRMKHFSKGVAAAAKKLKEKYEGIPEIPKVAEGLMKKTDSL